MSVLAANLSEPWFIQLENRVPHQRVDEKFSEVGYLSGTGPEMLIPSLPLQAFSQVERITRHDRITCECAAAILLEGDWIYAAG